MRMDAFDNTVVALTGQPGNLASDPSITCDSAQFAKGECRACSSNCATCAGAPANCTSCATGLYLHGQSCVDACPARMFADRSGRAPTCLPCHSTCEQCNGAMATDCLSCETPTSSPAGPPNPPTLPPAPPFLPNPFAPPPPPLQPPPPSFPPPTGILPFFHGSKCLDGCPAGYYGDANFVCRSCDSSCAECYGPTASECTACKPTAPILMPGGKCITTCPSGQFESSYKCFACDSTCVECTGADDRNCTKCDTTSSERPHLVDGTCTLRAGYRLVNGTLVAIDYCAEQGHTCVSPPTCINIDGGFQCSCPIGFNGDGITCNDIDECAANPCHAKATCTNTAGSYSCACTTSGYIGNGYVCSDEDECSTGSHNCQANIGVCTNLLSNYSCACASGYRGNGIDNCINSAELGLDPTASLRHCTRCLPSLPCPPASPCLAHVKGTSDRIA